MRKLPSSYQLPLALAIALHVILIIFLFVHLPATNYQLPGPTSKVEKTKVLKAVAVSTKQIDAQVAKIKRAEIQKRAREQARIRRLEAKAIAARRARVREQQRVTKLKQQRALEAKRLKALSQKRANALKAEQKALQDKLLKQQLSKERQALTQQQTRQAAGVVDRYKAQILHAIGQNWLVPGGANRALTCVYLIQLAPGGVVLSVKLLRSSGNSALDRSARVAIYKASPLPVPKNPALFDNFRELRLTVSPKTVTRSRASSGMT